MKFLSSLTEKDLANKICLLRVDLNIQDVDLSKNHPRVLAILPTIKFLIKNGTKVVILSHRGRPQNRIKNKELRIKGFSLKPFIKILSSLLKRPINFISLNKFGLLEETNEEIQKAKSENIFLMENLRFFAGEEKNDKKLAKQLASLGDIYINDAFSVCHRENASVAGITKYLPNYAGLLLEKEIKNLDKAIKSPKKPLVVILGGAKISDKIGAIKNFLKKVKGQKSKVNCILLGGGMANTFLAAQGLPVGDSLYDADLRGQIRGLTRTREFRQKVILPIDVLIDKRKILDIGPKTIEKYSKIIENAGTIIWNGPMGYIEDKKFRKGSEAIAKSIIKSKAFSVIGGGETTTLFQILNPKSYILNSNIFISTGGGAMLEYLAGKKLPGIEALN